jgi:hypothetical protein
MKFRVHCTDIVDVPEVDAPTADRLYALFDEDHPSGDLADNPALLELVRGALPRFVIDGARYAFDGYGSGRPKSLDLTFRPREQDPRGKTEERVRIRPSHYGYGVDGARRYVMVPINESDELAASTPTKKGSKR